MVRAKSFEVRIAHSTHGLAPHACAARWPLPGWARPQIGHGARASPPSLSLPSLSPLHQAFKFALYVTIPAVLTLAVATNAEVLNKVIKQVKEKERRKLGARFALASSTSTLLISPPLHLTAFLRRLPARRTPPALARVRTQPGP